MPRRPRPVLPGPSRTSRAPGVRHGSFLPALARPRLRLRIHRRWVLRAVRPLLLPTPTATRTWLGTPARPALHYPQFSAITLRADGLVAEMMVPPALPSLIPGGPLEESTPGLLLDGSSPLSHTPPYATAVLGRLRDPRRTCCSVMFGSGRLVRVTLAPLRHGSLVLGSRGPDADLARALLCWLRWERDSICVQRLIALAAGYLHFPPAFP